MSGPDLLRLGVLGSGHGSNFAAICRAIDQGVLPARIAAVLSDQPGAGILELGRTIGARTECIVPGIARGRLDPATEEKIVAILREEKVELVILAGFMRIIGPGLLAAYPRRIINVHPSLLPNHRGAQAAAQALAAGDQVTGCTVHYVDQGVDTGEIIARQEVEVRPDDTTETLQARIQVAEHALLPSVIATFARP
ncbi:MAG: phosphoribosylglycinamide formyltransferase [Chthoniobacterales bacterium]|nr:phosphoribosylglycinamide formyltransferase [Chthoniobacterales bacterium]